MILTDYFYPEHSFAWDCARLCGVEHGVLRLPETPDFDITSRAHWDTVVNRLVGFGVAPVVIEPMPNCVHDHIKLGDALRDESIARVIRMLGVMDALGIRTICFNFMAAIGWLRTKTDIPERGGAHVTGFDIDDFVAGDAQISEEQLWRNYAYFIAAVLPHAEKHGIRLALHPDDPPVSPLGGVGRIMTSYKNIRRAIDERASDMLGVTLCQAVYHLMGEDLFDVVPKLADKIFFIHFRNVTGDKRRFRETFHDNGDLPMGRLVGMYKDLGLNVPIRVDHVPTMPGEAGALPAGYTPLGRLFALGYLKGLMEK